MSDALRDQIVSALRTVFDPEIPVNVHDLGLIYDLGIEPGPDGGAVAITMTLTTPNCPMAETIVRDVERRVADVDGVASVVVHLVWEPKWDAAMMSEAAKLELEFTGHTGPGHVPGMRTSSLTIGATGRRPRPERPRRKDQR